VRAPLFALLTLALAACARHEPNPAAAAEVAAFGTEFERMQRELPQVYAKVPAGERDFRGRTFNDDIEQWVFSAQTRDEIEALEKRAAEANSAGEAKEIVARARERAQAEVLRAAAISQYWTAHLPAPYWRRYWDAVFESNRLPVEKPDSMLVATEQRITQSLDNGDFAQAGTQADELTAMLHESLNLASGRILKQRASAVSFSPRKTGCVQGAPPDPERRAPRIIRSEAVESFYPGEAIARGETGAVVLRTRVDRAGCGTHVAIVVHSGVESLDAAALRWFESAQFAPAMVGSQLIDSELTFKVKFELQN